MRNQGGDHVAREVGELDLSQDGRGAVALGRVGAEAARSRGHEVDVGSHVVGRQGVLEHIDVARAVEHAVEEGVGAVVGGRAVELHVLRAAQIVVGLGLGVGPVVQVHGPGEEHVLERGVELEGVLVRVVDPGGPLLDLEADVAGLGGAEEHLGVHAEARGGVVAGGQQGRAVGGVNADHGVDLAGLVARVGVGEDGDDVALGQGQAIVVDGTGFVDPAVVSVLVVELDRDRVGAARRGGGGVGVRVGIGVRVGPAVGRGAVVVVTAADDQRGRSQHANK
jgi:hypothetical protein